MNPVDVVKTQGQLNRGVNASMWAALRQQVAQGGVRRLYRGVLPVMMRPTAVAMCALPALPFLRRNAHCV